MQFYEKIPILPPDPIFGLNALYLADPRSEKFTFITGYFQNEDLTIPVLDSVAMVEEKMAHERLKRGYLPIDGDREFCRALGELIFGELYDESQTCAIQTVGGTGALFLAGKLVRHFSDQIAISDPTWPNHWNIFTHVGLRTTPYPYYANRELLFDQLVSSFESFSKGTCVLLHSNCHNTTGVDLSKEQWKQLADVIEKKELFPIFDLAYLGFSAEIEEDLFAPRYFLERGHSLALTFTASKCFSFYSERVGALFFVGDAKKMEAIRSQLKAEIRCNYSNPPFHGATVVKRILLDRNLKNNWLLELRNMRKRMEDVRKMFVDALIKKDPQGKWDFFYKGKGLFCLTDLKASQIKKLREEKGLYLAQDGRINLTGINQANLALFVEALIEAYYT